LDSLQKLVEAHDERLIVIQQESTQLMNAQQATEEDKHLGGETISRVRVVLGSKMATYANLTRT